MIYAKDANNNPQITTMSVNENIIQSGSNTARAHLIGLINNQNTIDLMITNKGSAGGGDQIGLNPSQINSFISGSVNVDNRTLGWGMTFLHESYHTTIGGGLLDSPYNPGPVVTQMNVIRSELNAQGGKYGQRLDYGTTIIGKNGYIPFSNDAKLDIGTSTAPKESSIYKYIKFKQ